MAVEEFSRAEHTNLLNLKRLKAEDAALFPKLVSEEHKAVLAQIFSRSIQEADRYECDSDRDLWRISVAEGNESIFQKLRWASLGYHYDWTSRKYYKDVFGEFPSELSELVKTLASVVGESIKPEAAIVNYYPANATMGGHLDDAELTMDKPIVSISIGCPAIFLIGGRNRSVRPTAVLIRSGDVLIMSRESRHSVHGVPKILPLDAVESDLLQYLRTQPFPNSCTELAAVKRYLCCNRININVRQVVESPRCWDQDAND
jgi:alkylated DNA repair protein alkB family protein 1